MVGILFLFFVPGSSLFNITYISLNVQGVSKAYSKDEVNTITIQSRDFPISVAEASSENISVLVYSNSLGFTLTKNSELGINSNLENGNLTFVVTEPHGLTSRGDSYIQLRVPANYSTNLSIINNNATVNIEKEDFTINNLYYTANLGEFNLNSGSIVGNLDLELNRSDFNLGENAVTNNNNVTINVNDGEFNATHSNLGEVLIESNTRAIFRIAECDRLTERVTTAGGRIEAGTIGSINVRTSDTNVYINTLTNGGTINLTDGGNIEISNTYALTDLTTRLGDISVNGAHAGLVVSSHDGSINVENAYLYVNATNAYGDINVNFSNEADSYTSETSSRRLVATTENGKITSNGVENLLITIDGSGRVEVNMRDVLGVNSIVGDTGSVSLIINKDSQYTLTTKSDAGNVSVDLMQVDVTVGNIGYTSREETTTRVNLKEWESSENSLVVTTTSGDLTIRDTGV